MSEKDSRTTKRILSVSSSSVTGGAPTGDEGLCNRGEGPASIRTSGISESGSGESEDASSIGEKANRNAKSGEARDKKDDDTHPPREVNALFRVEAEGPSGLSSPEYGSGSGGDDDNIEDKKMPARRKTESISINNNDTKPEWKDSEKRRLENVLYIQNFMSALLALKPKLSDKQAKAIQQKSKEKRERKRKVNRLSAQRKRVRERELLDSLSEQLKAYTAANQVLKKDREELTKLVEAARKLKQRRQQPTLQAQPWTGQQLLQQLNLPGATATGTSAAASGAAAPVPTIDSNPLQQVAQALLQNLQQQQQVVAAPAPIHPLTPQQLLQSFGQNLMFSTAAFPPPNSLQMQLMALMSGQASTATAATAPVPAPVQALTPLQAMLSQLQQPASDQAASASQQQLQAFLAQQQQQQEAGSQEAQVAAAPSVAATTQPSTSSLQEQLRALLPGNAQGATPQIQVPQQLAAPTIATTAPLTVPALQQQLGVLFQQQQQQPLQQPVTTAASFAPQNLALLQNLLNSSAATAAPPQQQPQQASTATASAESSGETVKRLLAELSAASQTKSDPADDKTKRPPGGNSE